MVVQDDHPECARRGLREQRGRVLDLRHANPAGLMAPRPHGVQADDVELLRAVEGLGRLPTALELLEGPGEAREWVVGDVVVAGDRENGRAEALEELGRAGVLVGAAAVGQVAARHDQLWIEALDKARETRLQLFRFVTADVEIREVKESCPEPGHRRMRLYTQTVVDEPAEIFDDLYLGLRAGGALRKKRRGEPLTSEEQEALGRWQRLGRVRKVVALGAFTLGTFGLGFTIGGLIFGRWRRA